MTLFPEPEFSLFTIIFGVFVLFLVVQFIYVTFIHAKFAFYKEEQPVSNQPLVPVSIIIAARNESDNLYDNLPVILSQDYPEYEVIVVNNQSIDDSGWLLTAFRQLARS
jgi:cellulose synthase/poly-beta-1,6-N-acetylglucosamine synthase-like glycosyltransferase